MSTEKKKEGFAGAFNEIRDMNFAAAQEASRTAIGCALTDEIVMRAFDKAFGKTMPKAVTNWVNHTVWGRTLNIYVLRPLAPLAVLNGLSLAGKVFGNKLPHSEMVSQYTRDALQGKWRDMLQPVYSVTAKMCVDIATELSGRALPQSTSSDSIAKVEEK